MNDDEEQAISRRVIGRLWARRLCAFCANSTTNTFSRRTARGSIRLIKLRSGRILPTTDRPIQTWPPQRSTASRCERATTVSMDGGTAALCAQFYMYPTSIRTLRTPRLGGIDAVPLRGKNQRTSNGRRLEREVSEIRAPAADDVMRQLVRDEFG